MNKILPIYMIISIVLDITGVPNNIIHFANRFILIMFTINAIIWIFMKTRKYFKS